MRGENSNRTILIGGVVFVLTLGIMLFLLASRCDVSRVFNTIMGANPVYIGISVVMICCFLVCEAINIARVLRTLGYRTSAAHSLIYSASGLFFSDITPSACGGQPMQLFFMHRDKVHLSHGMIALLTESLGYQVINCTLGVMGLLYNFSMVRGMQFAIRLVFAAGLTVNLCALIVLLLLLFSPRAVMIFRRISLRIFRNEKRREKILSQIEEYGESAEFLKCNSAILLKTMLTSLVQFAALYSIPYCVYLAIGLSGHSWLDLFMMQALLNAGVSALPMPGTVGAGESAFRVLFAAIFAESAMVPGMILCRGIGLYLGMLIAGVVLLLFTGMKVYGLRNKDGCSSECIKAGCGIKA